MISEVQKYRSSNLIRFTSESGEATRPKKLFTRRENCFPDILHKTSKRERSQPLHLLNYLRSGNPCLKEEKTNPSIAERKDVHAKPFLGEVESLRS